VSTIAVRPVASSTLSTSEDLTRSLFEVSQLEERGRHVLGVPFERRCR
jgi:hypothetical protein